MIYRLRETWKSCFVIAYFLNDPYYLQPLKALAMIWCFIFSQASCRAILKGEKYGKYSFWFFKEIFLNVLLQLPRRILQKKWGNNYMINNVYNVIKAKTQILQKTTFWIIVDLNMRHIFISNIYIALKNLRGRKEIPGWKISSKVQ